MRLRGALLLGLLALGLLGALLLPLRPVLREAAESEALLESLLAAHRPREALALLAALLAARPEWVPRPAEPPPAPWRPCDGRWPCEAEGAAWRVLRPEPPVLPGVEAALLLCAPAAASCGSRLPVVRLRARSPAGEAELALALWRAPRLSPMGGPWLAEAASGEGDEPGCDPSGRILGLRDAATACPAAPDDGDAAVLAALAAPLAGAGEGCPRPDPAALLLHLRGGWPPGCRGELGIGSAERPVVLVLDGPVTIPADAALAVHGVLLARRTGAGGPALTIAGRLAVTGLLAAEGLELRGELALDPDAAVLDRLGSRVLRLPAERGDGR
ncbi:MAG: hypothetical protein RML12_03055 [Xanthomonadales bacterium]|nr:hypothetical protein [Xanthomonadales bacterium]